MTAARVSSSSTNDVVVRRLQLTDWGDFGHLQPLPISYAGITAAAGFSWRAETKASEFSVAVLCFSGVSSPL